MLDQDESEAPVAAPAPTPDRTEARTWIVVVSIVVLALALCAAYFPSLFKSVTSYDDEGSFLLAIREFLRHGSLYEHTHGSYGPFYFSVAGALFRLTRHDPTLTAGRLFVLAFTGISAAMFAAAVWRIARSLPFALLCEVGTFVVLVRVAGTEPMHPGSMIVMALSVLAFALASYARKQRTAWLIVIGAAIGAIAMMKINVGLLAAAAIVIAFVVGNSQFPKVLRVVVGVGGAVLPFLITMQKLYQVDTTALAVLVSVGILATYASLSADTISIAPRALYVIGASIVATIVVSSLWPLATGTSPGPLFHGVVIQPLGQAEKLQRQHGVRFEPVEYLLAILTVYAVLARRYGVNLTGRARAWQLDAAFGLAGFFAFGLVIYGGFGEWIPIIVMLPALALLSDASPAIRLATRLFVPLAILQFLHVYPVAGSQTAWGRVVACVPAAIVMAAAAERLPGWREVGPALRGLTVGVIAVLTVAIVGVLPVAEWHNYEKRVALKLPGTTLIRVAPREARLLHLLTRSVKQHCDTFYSAPVFDSLYIYSRLPNPTGHLADTPGALNVREQREVARQLQDWHERGKRVCIVRDVERANQWKASSYGNGPLGKALANYLRQVDIIGRYTISIENSRSK